MKTDTSNINRDTVVQFSWEPFMSSASRATDGTVTTRSPERDIFDVETFAKGLDGESKVYRVDLHSETVLAPLNHHPIGYLEEFHVVHE